MPIDRARLDPVDSGDMLIMIPDDEAFVEVKLGYQTVQGKISIKLDEAITLDTSYQYGSSR